eukprot:358070-Chlamydomonas_euryale.AAC.2
MDVLDAPPGTRLTLLPLDGGGGGGKDERGTGGGAKGGGDAYVRRAFGHLMSLLSDAYGPPVYGVVGASDYGVLVTRCGLCVGCGVWDMCGLRGVGCG